MTVDELLTKLNAAFPAFNARALEAWGGAYREALGKHEGSALKAAYTAVLGSFTPKASKALHPMVADFLPHLPGSYPKLSEEAGIRGALDERKARRDRALLAWQEGQGAKIKVARAAPVYAACLMLAMEKCGRTDWRLLTAEQIEFCEARALSSARVRMFGPRLPATNEEWDGQIAQVRESWTIQPKAEAA